MREILFRGKKLSDGAWVEGDLSRCVVVGETHIWRIEDNLSTTTHRIDPETVCQYTGLSDRNGKRIFEGDVVRNFLCIDDHNEPLYEYGKVVYIPERISFEIWDDDNNQITTTAGLEVIGNIFDNPELIGEQP